ncbi:amino acid ABC transporter substrate-binding protein [Pseudohoeflea coraliihabitans]|uniref:Amino acid ABC transporter substrate-binding protein n=1 Tax=Pseudohoeflea coraliihabitans TaxID=2860393 RepID=A0ABS6WNE6_9HYPH|nr:amino acid ABC transporter substrate-binding protein [Pseudohoeflea sp. DP4N28-3]MBW3097478.1 amino acid ABC transporter substrate-binding protein [Pseudohoeflea sp. DP4N28-3]
MDRRNFLATSGALALSSTLPRMAFAQDNTITFGGSIPMTGGAAETGLNVLNGYRCAVKYINEEMGGAEIGGEKYQLALNLFDDASDPSRATTLIQSQVDEGIDFFLGSFGSSIVLPTCAITEAAGRIMVQAGGGSDLIFTQGRERVFGIFPRASKQFVSSVNMFTSLDPKVETVSILYTNNAFSKFQAEGARTSLEEAGIKVLDFIALPAQVNDVSNVLTTIRENTPDVLVCTTHDEPSILIARQMVATNTNVPMLYQTLGPQTAGYRDALGNYANGVVTQAYWSERAPYSGDYFGSAADFAKYYNANFERELTYHMASGAACIVSYVQAAKNAGTLEVGAVRDALAALDFECFYGQIRFTEDGDGDAALLGPLLIQRQDGEMEVIAPAEGASAEPIYPAPTWEERA